MKSMTLFTDVKIFVRKLMKRYLFTKKAKYIL